MFASQAAIFFYDAKSNELEDQILDNSMDLRLKQKYSSNKISEINTRYDREESMIRNEIDGLDDKTGDEYKELLSEIKDLNDARDRELEREEKTASDYQNRVQIENDTLQTQKEAIDSDREGFEELLKKEIESEFGYFQ